MALAAVESGDGISMFRRQASMGRDEFESASINVQGNALTDHIQSHDKAEAVTFFFHHAHHAGQRARHHTNPVSFAHERVGFDRFASDDAPK